MRNRQTLPVILGAIALTSVLLASDIRYPVTRKTDHVDTYHGTTVPDPYRWLEDDNSPETAAWVAAQNKVTFDYLEKIPYRAKVLDRLRQIYNYPKYSAPSRRGGLFFFSRNDGLQNQAVLYVQKSLDGTPEVLIDPNKFSDDGTARLGTFSVSKNGRYAAYGVSMSGSDWQDYRVMEIATRQTLADHLRWIKVSGIAWQGDGFYYSRYDEPPAGRELSSKNEGQKVFFHRLGTPQSSDELVYDDPSNPQRFHGARTTDDERFLILTSSDRGKGRNGNSLFYRDVTSGDKGFKPIVSEIGDSEFSVIDNIGDKFLILTNQDAPNRRILLFDPASPAGQEWKAVLPEKPEPLKGASLAGGRLLVTYTRDVATRAEVYNLEGRFENGIPLPGPGTASGFDGRKDDTFVFYTFSTFNYPPTIFRYDIGARKSSVFRTAEIPGVRPADYETRQVFFRSKDGTRVPMFVVHRKGLPRDGNNPALLYAYGGFNISTSPGFNPLLLGLLEQGFVYASANIRGGGEYGEKWHQAGMKLNKQNVFDDFAAAAEYLIAERYTSPGRLAARGGSNGGLLVGAVINQHPGLFRAAIPQVGVMDMLRFHKFTIGWNWIADYGSSDNPEEFKALYAYSPLHNIRAGVKYPATLITTADHDDRVVPAHSFKYAATLQERADPANPVLIRIETKSGHGASSTSKMLETDADIYSFLFFTLGVNPK